MMTFRVSLPSKGWYSVPRQRLLRASAMMFVVVALLVSFRIAVLRGFDHTIGPDSWGRFTFAVGAALTDRVYGVPGYVIDVRVETFLGANGLTGDQAVLTKLGLSFPANLRDATLLNSVIERAASLSYPPPPPLRGTCYRPYGQKHALVFDLMEPLRPLVDAQLLKFMQSQAFAPGDFAITSNGVCRLNSQFARKIVALSMATPTPHLSAVDPLRILVGSEAIMQQPASQSN